MGLKYSKESIAFQRKKIYQIIKDKSLFKRVSKYRYYSELKHSKFLISPFGFDGSSFFVKTVIKS